MIEVRVFATLRQGRDKVTMLPPEGIATAADILSLLDIPAEEVSILLINGFPEAGITCSGRRYCGAVSSGGRRLIHEGPI